MAGGQESSEIVGLENLSKELNVVHLESCHEENEEEGKSGDEAPTEIKLAILNAQHEYLSERANFMRKEELEKEGGKQIPNDKYQIPNDKYRNQLSRAIKQVGRRLTWWQQFSSWEHLQRKLTSQELSIGGRRCFLIISYLLS